MFSFTYVSWLLVATAFAFGDAHLTDYPSNDIADDSSIQLKTLEKLWQNHQHGQHSGDSCHDSQRDRASDQYAWERRINDVKSGREYPGVEYPDALEYEFNDKMDYNEPEQRENWHKRSPSMSPFISLGALSNLPQFFEQLKGSMDRLDQQQSQQAQMQAAAAAAAAAESDRAFRPPSTAAVLHAFRNYRPLRRTRSFPPALVHG